MKNNKSNQGGFTLVELIVVVALMAIVFGALMNVIKPTNQFFKDSEAFKDEVMVSEGLTDALAGELRYSTNVLVLKNYVGVPKIDANGMVEGIPDVKFDSAILIENDNVRGSYESDFYEGSNSTATVGRTKRARGQIIKFDIGGLGINFNVSSLLTPEDYYGDYNYFFTADGKNDENGRSYIDFGVTMNDLVSENGNWVINEDNYTSSEFLYLKNININDNDGFSMVVKDFHNSNQNDDYVGFERTAAVPGVTTSTAQQAGLFNGSNSSNTHTWILYYSGDVINAGESIKLTFDPMEGGANAVEMNAQVGRPFNQMPPTFPEPGKDTYVDDETGKPYRLRFVGWKSVSYPTDEPLTNEAIMAYIPLEDETFQAQYVAADATYKVTIYTTDGAVFFEKDGITFGTDISGYIPDYSYLINHTGYDGFYWMSNNGTGVSDIITVDFTNIVSDLSIKPYFYKNHNVKFYDEDGNVVHEEQVKTGFGVVNSVEVPAKAGYSGVWKIKNDDGTLSEAVLSNITDDINLVPEYTLIPVQVPHLTISDINSSPNQWWRTTLKFKITNDGDKATSNFKITVPMTEDITLVEGNWNFSGEYHLTASFSGKNIIIDGSAATLKPGESMNIELTAQNGSAVVNGDIVVSDLE